MTDTPSPAVTDYLSRLERAASALPPEQRAELVAGVREHLADLQVSAPGEAAVHEALDRFGTPEQLVAAEAEQAGLLPLPPAAPAARPVWGGLELSAVLLVLLGGFIVPVVAPLVGVVLAWQSPRWGRGTKVGATLLLIAPAVLAVVALVLPLVWLTALSGPGTAPAAQGWWAAAPNTSRLVLVVASLLVATSGWLVSGLWLALAGRRPR